MRVCLCFFRDRKATTEEERYRANLKENNDRGQCVRRRERDRKETMIGKKVHLVMT